MTASPAPPHHVAETCPPEVVAAVFHAAVADPNLAVIVAELREGTPARIRWTNPAASELLATASSDLENQPIGDFVTGPDGASVATLLRRERTTTGSVTVRTALGERTSYRARATPAPLGPLWTLQLYPAHQDLEVALRASADAHEHRFKVLAERSPVPTMMSEQGMRLSHANDALCALLGVTADELAGTAWMTYAHPEDLDTITETALGVLGGQQREIHARFLDSGGGARDIDMRFTPLHTAGVGDGFVATLEDITDRRAFEERLDYQVSHDSLTGLPRRTKLWAHVAAVMEDPDAGLACMFLDLDNFKVVNDSLGHRAGDALLAEVANRLSACVAPGDMVARFGGDEFVVASRTDSLDDALDLANRLLRVLSDPLVLDRVEIHPRGSIGVVMRGADHRSADDLIRDCDIAMYQAKASGKGCIMVLDESARTAAHDTLALVADLHQAIDEHRITLCYQPILRVVEGGFELASVEALARWTHPARGIVPVEFFVSLAEEHGLVRALSQVVLETACADLATWEYELGELAPPRINVNISALQMSDSLVVQDVQRAMQRYGVRPGQLCLEITESALMRDRDAASVILSQLRDQGVQVAIDDFGTGYSSLAYLRRLPVNYLKVDRSFVAELQDGHTAVTQAVIGLAHNLGIGVVAEGTETADQMDLLARMECSLLQGYAISKPLTAEEFVRWCRAGRPLACEAEPS